MVLENRFFIYLLVPSKELGSQCTFFTQKAKVTPWGLWQRQSICLNCLAIGVISVKDYLLGAPMASNI